MTHSNFNADIAFGEKSIKTEMILESSFTKEIRIVLQKGAVMKEHKTPYAIVVHVLSGKVDFSIGKETHPIVAGDILSLEGNVVHELRALEDSTVRLTLSKHDKAERMKGLEE